MSFKVLKVLLHPSPHSRYLRGMSIVTPSLYERHRSLQLHVEEAGWIFIFFPYFLISSLYYERQKSCQKAEVSKTSTTQWSSTPYVIGEPLELPTPTTITAIVCNSADNQVSTCCLNILQTPELFFAEPKGQRELQREAKYPKEISHIRQLCCERCKWESGKTAGWVGKQLTVGKRTAALVPFLVSQEKKCFVYFHMP